MIALKIVLIVLAVIVLLIAVALSLRVKLVFTLTEENGFDYHTEYLGKVFGKKKSRITSFILKRLGLDIFDAEAFKSINTMPALVKQLVVLLYLFFEQIKYLFLRLRVEKLNALVVCGGDSAEAAVDYGLVCATLYPLFSYITSNINIKENAENLNVCCDFNGDSKIEFDFVLSIRAYFVAKAVLSALIDFSNNESLTEVTPDE